MPCRIVAMRASYGLQVALALRVSVAGAAPLAGTSPAVDDEKVGTVTGNPTVGKPGGATGSTCQLASGSGHTGGGGRLDASTTGGGRLGLIVMGCILRVRWLKIHAPAGMFNRRATTRYAVRL